jgi:hypothetical protein
VLPPDVTVATTTSSTARGAGDDMDGDESSTGSTSTTTALADFVFFKLYLALTREFMAEFSARPLIP